MTSRIIDIEFESKRHIKDGIYLLNNGYTDGPIIPNCIVNVTEGQTQALVSNLSEYNQILSIGDITGHFYTTDNCEIINTDINVEDSLTNPNISSTDASPIAILSAPNTVDSEERPPLIDPDELITTLKFDLGELKVGKQLSDSEKSQLIQTITDFKDVIAFDGHLGRTNLIEYQIEVDRTRPVHVRPYRVSPQQRTDVIKQAQSMLEADIIRPSRSAWNSPIVMVKKKDNSFRFCTDLRKLNELTKNWCYEIPLINDYLRSLAGYRLFCSLDANQGFYQVPIRESDKELTSFIVPGFGSFEYNVMPMGAKCSPATYQALMDKALGSLKFTCALVYIDDVLITGLDFKDTLDKLILVLSALRKANLTIKPDKCVFMTTALKFLGHIVDKHGIHTDPKKVNAILDMSEPKDQKALRSFLGKCNYFNDHIDEYSIIAAPLYELLKIDVKYEWADTHRKAFHELKLALAKAPILAHFNPDYETELITDASTIGIAWKLRQRNPETNKWHPILYGSQKLKEAERKYPITELECLAVVTALKKNRQYLQGLNFKLITDHKSLKALLTKKELPGRLARWSLIVAEFPEIEIIHRPGSQIEDVDLMSRYPVDNPDEYDVDDYITDRMFMLITDTNEIPSNEDYRFHQEMDPEIGPIIRYIENGGFSNIHLIRNDLLYRMKEGKLVIELPESMIENIMYIHHDHPLSGHRDSERTYQRIRDRFHFKGMRKRINDHVISCTECLHRKRVPGFPAGYMQIPKPMGPAEKWFIDFLGPFPTSDSGNKYVFVAVCSFTRFVVTCATPDSTAETVIKVLRK